MSLSRQNKRKLDPEETLAMSTPNSRIRVSNSSNSIQFFVRTHKSLVLRASPESTISSIISLILNLNGETDDDSSSYRLISNGRQLDPYSTLATCRVSNDSTLFLVCRLPSTRFPRSFQLVADLLLIAKRLSECRPTPAEIKPVSVLLLEFLVSTPSSSNSSSRMDHLDAFVLSAVPAALVNLYVTNRPGCRVVADTAICIFLKHARETASAPISPSQFSSSVDYSPRSPGGTIRCMFTLAERSL